MRSKTLSLFESFKDEYEKEDKVLAESEELKEKCENCGKENCTCKESEVLEEKINKDNVDINNKIRQSLRSKREARKNEPELAKHGIKVNYDGSQGTVITGSNGKKLFDDRHNVYGPSNPGFNNTHAKPDKYYEDMLKHYEDSAEKYSKKAEELKAMSRDDIIRKYNDKTTEEALAAHKAEIERVEKWANEYKNDAESYKHRSLRDRQSTRRQRREGHERNPRSSYSKGISKDDARITYGGEVKDPSTAEKVDYLNYLTKKPTGYRVDDQDYFGNGKAYNPADNMNKNMRGYEELKRKENYAKDHLDYQNKYYGVKSDEELNKDAEAIRARAEEDIKKAQERNEKNKESTKSAKDAVDAATKAKKDYIDKIRAERAAKK